MKPIITISDYNILMTMLKKLPFQHKTNEVPLLIRELERAIKVKDFEIDSDIIRLNSSFIIYDNSLNKEMEFTLTLPKSANLPQKKVSILSPIGVALIGFKAGMTIDCVLPGGQKKINILNVWQEE